MELTQRLASTQSLDETLAQAIIPEQVGFLGICGQKYPVVRGPNKIGRDPDTCNIVLNLNSISRHHAVINVINSSEFMLMDLNSANKTKLDNKTLMPYIPYPLRNGNMVQLGQIFGIFSSLQDDNDLPMTQALDIPDTPIASRNISKLNNIHATTVPESPDVSDKDDSFIMPSQPKQLKHSGTTKSAGKALEQPTARKKIDNNFWNSSRKSDSINLQSNTTIRSPDSLFISIKNCKNKITPNNIHELNTQIPNDNNESTDSLFTAETQMLESRQSLNIYNMETQVPVVEKLQAVGKVSDQQNLALEFFTDNKENDIFEAETQAVVPNKPIIKRDVEIKSHKKGVNASQNTSDDIIIFDEMESEPIEVFESQALLPEDEVETQNLISLNKNECVIDKGSKRKERHTSDSSTDCEDDIISLSQNRRDQFKNDDDETDCEDVPPNEEEKKKPDDDDLTDCEDDLFAPHVNAKRDALENDVALEDLPTQVVLNAEKDIKTSDGDKDNAALEDLPTQVVSNDEIEVKTNENDIDDMLTQVVQVNQNENNLDTEDNIDDMLTQVVIPEDSKKYEKSSSFQMKPSNSPFKVPLSPMKTRKDIKNVSKKSPPEPNNKDNDVLDFHYASTQEVFDDLCSQNEIQIVVPSPQKKLTEANKISTDTVKNNIINQKDLVDVSKPKKVGSDSSSDVEITPKKTLLTFMEVDLPDSQEIKSSMARSNRNDAIELTSDSETENESEQCTPILFRHSKKKSCDAKMNLSSKFDFDALPTRIITRVRKPTAKALSNADTFSSNIKNILKPKFFQVEPEDNIDAEIILENLSRLKSKAKAASEKTKKRDSTKTARKTEKEESKIENSKRKSKDKNADKKNTKDNKQNTIDGYLNRTSDKSTSSSRTTRSRAKNKAADERSTSDDAKSRNMKVEEEKSKNIKVQEKANKSDSEQTVRRSRRRKAQDEQQISKEIEKSKVYSVNSSRNSESSLDSSNALKRSAEFQFPSAKKAKTSGSGYTVDTQYVLFTAFPNEEVKNKLITLGAVIVNDVMHCTVVLTLQIKRTFKLLCAVGLGRPVVGPAWVQACADAGCILDPNQYILRDEVTEQRFQFDLQKTIRSRRNFLKGYKVSSTPKVLPNAKEMKMIVECSGGTWKEGGKNWLCVSCPADKPLWPQYKRKGAIVVSTELILAGVLRQKLDIEGNKLV